VPISLVGLSLSTDGQLILPPSPLPIKQQSPQSPSQSLPQSLSQAQKQSQKQSQMQSQKQLHAKKQNDKENMSIVDDANVHFQPSHPLLLHQHQHQHQYGQGCGSGGFDRQAIGRSIGQAANAFGHDDNDDDDFTLTPCGVVLNNDHNDDDDHDDDHDRNDNGNDGIVMSSCFQNNAQVRSSARVLSVHNQMVKQQKQQQQAVQQQQIQRQVQNEQSKSQSLHIKHRTNHQHQHHHHHPFNPSTYFEPSKSPQAPPLFVLSSSQ
jgi:hypothetical protein